MAWAATPGEMSATWRELLQAMPTFETHHAPKAALPR